MYLQGIELINEPNASGQEITIPSGVMNIRGRELPIAASAGVDSLSLKGSLTGTKGGFSGYYIDENGDYQNEVQAPESQEVSGTISYNGASSDSITGLPDDDTIYNTVNGQGNLVRIRDATDTDKMLLVPTARSTTTITFANDFDGVADTTLFSGNKQFQDDGTTRFDFFR
jgi:hypothetical protein